MGINIGWNCQRVPHFRSYSSKAFYCSIPKYEHTLRNHFKNLYLKCVLSCNRILIIDSNWQYFHRQISLAYNPVSYTQFKTYGLQCRNNIKNDSLMKNTA